MGTAARTIPTKGGGAERHRPRAGAQAGAQNPASARESREGGRTAANARAARHARRALLPSGGGTGTSVVADQGSELVVVSRFGDDVDVPALEALTAKVVDAL